MPNTPRPPVRRRTPDPHERPEDGVAHLLYMTYQIECRRYDNQLRSDDSAREPAGFAKDFVVDRDPVKRRRIEQVENPEIAGRDRRREDRREQFWRELAEWVIRHSFDPERFVRAQFSATPAGRNPPQPNMLKGDAAVANYHKAARLTAGEVRAAFMTQVTAFKKEATLLVESQYSGPGDGPLAWASVLRDTDAQLSALFRYCMAVSLTRDPKVSDPEPFRRLADDYRTAAALQYVLAPEAYDATWGAFIPPGWPAEAQGVYRTHYGF